MSYIVPQKYNKPILIKLILDMENKNLIAKTADY